MYLKSLELHGFKSFPEKTVLHFDAGSTVIVGPNGSGKSNITDAMRWVLGELSSRSIRGTKMEDVIFIGADGRKPMSFAEVSVTFDNTGDVRVNSPYDEITVTRRYYRAGESEYFINRKPCRLRDIYELFMNTGIGREGYSIIGQGKIAEIISKKSEDRRGIFEETAGISKFRYQKEEAEKRLAATNENVERVLDVFNELEVRIPTLEKESAKARRYLDLYEQKKEADISLWLYDINRMTADRDKTESDCRLSAHEMEMISDTERSVEAQSDRLYEASMENKQAAQRLYEEIRSLRDRQSETESAFKVLETNLGHVSEMTKEQDREKAAVEQSLRAAEKDGRKLAENCRRMQSLLGEAEESAAEVVNERSGLAEMRREKEQLAAELAAEQTATEASLTDHKVKLSVLRSMISDHESRGATVGSEIEAYKSKVESIRRELDDVDDVIRTYTEAIEKSDAALREADRAIEASEAKSQSLRRKLAETEASAGAIDSRISALRGFEEHFEGYIGSVRFVMGEAQKGRISGIRGPLSQLIRVPAEYTVAVETALGNALQNLVVDDEKAAKAAIGLLKQSGAGRATFYPISSIRGQNRTRELDAASAAAGFVGYADELVQTENTYREIVSSLLGRIAVFSDLDRATDFAKSQSWRVRCVTLDGQQINAGGSFTGGSAKRDSGILTRASQIEKLEAEKRALESSVASIRKELAACEKDAEETAAGRITEQEKKTLVETLRTSEQAHRDGLAAQLEVAENHLTQLSADASALTDEQDRGAADVTKLEAISAREEETLASLAEKRAALDAVRAGLDEQMEEIGVRMAETQVLLAERRKDMEAADAAAETSRDTCRRLSDEIAAHSAEIARLADEEKRIRREMAEKKTAAGDFTAALDKKEEERSRLENEGMDFEKRLQELRGQLKEIGARKEIIFRAHSRNESKLEQLRIDIDKMTERLWDEYELTHSTAAALGYPPVVYGERTAAAERLTELRNQLRGLGNVNVASIDEYKEVKERYDAMKLQLDDLEAAKADIETLIAGIEDEMRRMFTVAFDQININFNEVFQELFGGGHAHLTLSDPNDVLNCGIEISVAPPGKMIKSLTLLSGGEQAFVAIALLFALIRVNPSPFCIFDEIEAALDEVNVTRVARYIKRYSRQMQIIMITHRRGTMEIADTLYGVTMPRHGISKVFTLDAGAVSGEEAEMLTGDKQPKA